MSRAFLLTVTVSAVALASLVGACGGGVVQANCVNDLCSPGGPTDASVDLGADTANPDVADASPDTHFTCGIGICPTPGISCALDC
ncbi:MAG: hypothetical protein ACHREM_29255, partial [Polyangiales bacterium]